MANQGTMRQRRAKEAEVGLDPRWSALAETVSERLATNKRIRRTLPDGGRLRIDRQLPFLCLYRRPPGKEDPGTKDLVTTEAAYLFATGERRHHSGLTEFCRTIADTLIEHFGVFLLIELWTDTTAEQVTGAHDTAPRFSFFQHADEGNSDTTAAFRRELESIQLMEERATFELHEVDGVVAPGLTPLQIPPRKNEPGKIIHVGLGVKPVYRTEGGTLFPLVLERLRRQLALSLRGAIHASIGFKQRKPRSHFHSLGPSSLVKAARLVDQQLSEVSESFDFLLQVTPINTEQAWADFCESGYQTEPVFRYRPLPYRPSLLKRRLFDIPVERIEDVTLSHLFWQKQDELDRQITALRDIGTPRFQMDSLQLYGTVDDALLSLAQAILHQFPEDSSDNGGDCVGSDVFVRKARKHLDYYHQKMATFGAKVEVCDDLAAGLMVAQNRLLVSRTLRVRRDRVEALLSHEIGTHLLTYFNGKQQPFRQLYAGLAGYEELQEGLAVLAEYFVAGLTTDRLRTIAGRVIAVKSLIEDQSFTATFQKLVDEYGFSPRSAFTMSVRVYRGGGLTKDAIYLRGLRDLLKYLQRGHEMEPLYVGKIALQHVPYIQELRRRRVTQPAAVLPWFWEQPDHQERLDACRGMSVLELMERMNEDRTGC